MIRFVASYVLVPLLAVFCLSMVLYTPSSQRTEADAQQALSAFYGRALTPAEIAMPIEPKAKQLQKTRIAIGKRKLERLQQQSEQGHDYSYRTQLTAFLLCLLVGIFGVHRFYSGHYLLGALQLLTLGCCGIFTLVDLILISLGEYRDAEGQRLLPWTMDRQRDRYDDDRLRRDDNGDYYRG